MTVSYVKCLRKSVVVVLRARGREFHSLGDIMEKDLLPYKKAKRSNYTFGQK